MTQELTVHIQRSSGKLGESAYSQTWHVPVVERMSVLDVVASIQAKQDSSLAYRYSCRAGMCGTCSMRVNGRNRWTCRTPVKSLASSVLRLEPLPNYPVLRDLVVDMAPFFEGMARIRPEFVPRDPQKAGFAKISPDSPERREINQHVECITCGNCMSACGITASNPHYLGPAALNRVYALILDSRDAAARLRLDAVNRYEGLWGCHSQFNCVEACPMGIEPARAIQKLKRGLLKHAFHRAQ